MIPPISLRLIFLSLFCLAPTSSVFGAVFSNPGVITITDNAAGSPYPSTITVSGFDLGTTIIDVNVTITGLTHPYPDDVGLLLVDPTGNFTARLMTDAGGSFSISNVNLIFDSQTANALPNDTQITSGAYRPIQGTPNELGEGHDANFPAPAPAGPYANTLDTFNGISPNGIWSLYVDDDSTPDAGSINGGWSLDIIVVPEPSTWTLLGFSAVAALGYKYLRRRRSVT